MSDAITMKSISCRVAVMFALLGAATLLFSGCGMIHGEGQIGNGLRPRGEAGISIPFGK